MSKQRSNDENEVTAGNLAERFVQFAQTEWGIELRSGETYGVNLEALMRPGEALRSNRGQSMNGYCAECGDSSVEQPVKACEYCQVLLCSKHWPDHTCAGKDAVDLVIRKEREAAEHLIVAAEHKYRAFRAEMERFRPKDELQAAEWDSAWEAHWREWKAWLGAEWGAVRIGHWGDKWVDDVLHQEEMTKGRKAGEFLLEMLDKVPDWAQKKMEKRGDTTNGTVQQQRASKPRRKGKRKGQKND